MRFVSYFLSVLIFATACDFTISPSSKNYYFPLDVRPAKRSVYKFNYFYWPWDWYGVIRHPERVLEFQDITPTYLEYARFSLHKKNNIISYVGYPVFKIGKYRVGASYLNKTIIYDAWYLDISIYLNVQYTRRRFISGIGFRGLGIAAHIHDKFDIRVPLDIFNMVYFYNYLVLNRGNVKFFIGPTINLSPFSGAGLNLGLGIYNNGKEYLRLSGGLYYYRDDVYDRYNLYPMAFDLSVSVVH